MMADEEDMEDFAPSQSAHLPSTTKKKKRLSIPNVPNKAAAIEAPAQKKSPAKEKSRRSTGANPLPPPPNTEKPIKEHLNRDSPIRAKENLNFAKDNRKVAPESPITNSVIRDLAAASAIESPAINQEDNVCLH